MMRRIALLLLLVVVPVLATAQTLALQPGTPVKAKLQRTLATFANRNRDLFYAQVSEPVIQGGTVVIPTGAMVQGHLTQVSEPRRIKGKPTIGMHFDSVTLLNGAKFALDAVLVDTSLRDGSDVNEEGQFKGNGHDKYDLRETAIGGGGGILMGALIGGAEGGAIGAGVGAGATGVHWLIKKRSAVLPKGTELVMEISRPTFLPSGAMGVANPNPGN